MQIGLIGTGAIGRFLIRTLNDRKLIPGTRVVAVLDERKRAGGPERGSEGRPEEVRPRVAEYTSLQSFLQSGIDIVVEAASPQAAAYYGPLILENGISMVLCSAGCLADKAMKKRFEDACYAGRARCHVPSGAIGGLDLIQAANSLGELETVTIITRKPVAGLGVSASFQNTEQLLFEGNAAEAIARFPRNVNSSVALSLAGIGSGRTQVRVIADAHIRTNTHVIRAAGAFGDMELTVRNRPMPTNPRTSYLAALSVLSLLQKLNSPICIGG